MPRFFTLDQAQSLLPEAERLLRAAVSARKSLAEAEVELTALQRHVMAMGGVRPDPVRALALRKQRDNSAQTLKESVETIHEYGVQIKDLEMGLIDFPTLYRGEEVLLCFKLGETGITCWHGLNEGFRGRKPIDRDFLDNHTGDETH